MNSSEKAIYLLLSCGIGALMIFTALPYRILSSLVIPELNMYWSYETVQLRMMILFVALPFIGVLETLWKHPTVEDVFLNVATPLLVLLVLRSLQVYFLRTIAVCLFVGIWAYRKGRAQRKQYKRKWNPRKLDQQILLQRRRILIYGGLLFLVPMTVFAGIRENSDRERIVQRFAPEAVAETSDSQSMELEAEIGYPMPSEELWNRMDVNSRLKEVKDYADYLCNQLGVNPLEVVSVREIEDGVLGKYSRRDDCVYINVVYLNEYGLREMIHVTAHEVYHAYEHRVIECLEMLEDEGVPCDKMEEYRHSRELREARDNYYWDSQNSITYHANLMEVESEDFAFKQELYFEQYGVLTSGEESRYITTAAEAGITNSDEVGPTTADGADPTIGDE